MSLPLRQSLTRHGYAGAIQYLPAAVLQTLRRQRDPVLSRLPSAHRDTYRSQGSLVNLGDHPEFAHLIGSSEVQALIQILGPASCCWLAGYLISNPPNGPALFWHQGWWGWDHPLSDTSRLDAMKTELIRMHDDVMRE